MPSLRKWSLFLPCLIAVTPLFAASGAIDPEFAKVPFDEWLKGAGQAHLKWRAHVFPAKLSMYQRLWSQIEVGVDGAELAARRGKGQFLVFVQFTDDAGNRYQDHGTIELEKLQEGIRSQDMVYTQRVFVTPGDYHIAFAIFDNETGEHSVHEERLRVGPLKGDPLPPDAGRDLPPVEFAGAVEPPDGWYLPAERGRLHLNFAPREPVRVELILNMTPSERLAGSTRVQDANLSGLLPMLKLVAQAGGPDAPVNISVLDLERRRVTFHQNNSHSLDWRAFRETLQDKAPGVIDVKALEDRQHNAAFFVQEIARKLGPAPGRKPPVIVVLSSPVEFGAHEDLSPISVDAPPGSRIYYIRYRPPAQRPNLAMMNPRDMRGGRPMGGMGGRRGGPLPGNRDAVMDQLASTLKPLSPRIIDIETPDQFRKALAMMLSGVAGL